MESGSSLAVQWLGLCVFTAVAWVQSLVGELSSHKLHSAAKILINQSINQLINN